MMTKVYILCLLLLLLNTVYTLPIFSSSSSSSSSSNTAASSSFALISSSIISSTETRLVQQQQQQQQEEEEEEEEEEEYIPSSLIENTEEQKEEEKCPNTEYGIPVERFAQLVSTHWHFDHLDSIKSGTYKIISEQFQEHIQISIEPIKDNVQQQQQQQEQQQQEKRTLYQRQRSFTSTSSSSWDMMMDLEILHAQIFGAIQAHTEGSLHIAWDRLSDKLGQPAFEQFIRTIALNYCTLDSNQEGLLSSTCLKDKASQLSLELDEYINLNLNRIFIALEKDVLPKLLSNTSKDLADVLAYFNRLFLLKDNQHLYLQVKPWDTTTTTHNNNNLNSKLQPLLNRSVLNDNHLIDFFENYACLSRA